MDKLYKPHFLSQLKARMPVELPEFVPHKIPPVGHPLRGRFSGSKLYLRQLATRWCAWLDWFPCEGVDREFFVHLGWSADPETLPVNQPGDRRIYDLRGPDARLACGSLNVQRMEDRQVVEGFRIATPWDQLYELSPRASEAERKRMMDKAYAEYLAVTDAERVEAVRRAMDDAFRTTRLVLPEFLRQLEALPGEV